jgi:hypothetical protein
LRPRQLLLALGLARRHAAPPQDALLGESEVAPPADILALDDQPEIERLVLEWSGQNEAFCASPVLPNPIFLAEVIGNIQVRD